MQSTMARELTIKEVFWPLCYNRIMQSNTCKVVKKLKKELSLLKSCTANSGSEHNNNFSKSVKRIVDTTASTTYPSLFVIFSLYADFNLVHA